MITFGISTWSIHRTLADESVTLVDVPAMVREHGMTDLQICHFHLPARDPNSLSRLRHEIEDAGVKLNAMLLDFGDLSHPDQSPNDCVELESWLHTAADLGAKYARISAGQQAPTDESLRRAADHLLRLADVGERLGVKVVTENWHAMVPNSAAVARLQELTNHRVPLCLDFGNWSGPGKYEELQHIAPATVTVHAKCAFSKTNEPDSADFVRCCEILKQANYAGTIALIYDGPSDDEWRYLDDELKLARTVYPV